MSLSSKLLSAALGAVVFTAAVPACGQPGFKIAYGIYITPEDGDMAMPPKDHLELAARILVRETVAIDGYERAAAELRKDTVYVTFHPMERGPCKDDPSKTCRGFECSQSVATTGWCSGLYIAGFGAQIAYEKGMAVSNTAFIHELIHAILLRIDKDITHKNQTFFHDLCITIECQSKTVLYKARAAMKEYERLQQNAD